MSLFMTGLAFINEAHLAAAKLGTLIASLCAGIVGSVILARLPQNRQAPPLRSWTDST